MSARAFNRTDCVYEPGYHISLVEYWELHGYHGVVFHFHEFRRLVFGGSVDHVKAVVPIWKQQKGKEKIQMS